MLFDLYRFPIGHNISLIDVLCFTNSNSVAGKQALIHRRQDNTMNDTLILLLPAIPATIAYNLARDRSELVRQIGSVVIWGTGVLMLRVIFS
jgi:hypothetical protein|tara:strand:+ start:480 stop:755 length:276 start_codon:yes stop_codon:yes gene_type:complete